jgi:hypothetical protein
MHGSRRNITAAIPIFLIALMGVTGFASATVKERPIRPPKVWTMEATSIHGTYAELKGWVDARGQRTTFGFEFGTTQAYGTDLELSVEHELHSYRTVEVAEAIPGLRPHTTYHFRVYAHSRGGTTYGKDKTFRTRGRATD